MARLNDRFAKHERLKKDVEAAENRVYQDVVTLQNSRHALQQAWAAYYAFTHIHIVASDGRNTALKGK